MIGSLSKFGLSEAMLRRDGNEMTLQVVKSDMTNLRMQSRLKPEELAPAPALTPAPASTLDLGMAVRVINAAMAEHGDSLQVTINEGRLRVALLQEFG